MEENKNKEQVTGLGEGAVELSEEGLENAAGGYHQYPIGGIGYIPPEFFLFTCPDCGASFKVRSSASPFTTCPNCKSHCLKLASNVDGSPILGHNC